jgi:hypothetical protein
MAIPHTNWSFEPIYGNLKNLNYLTHSHLKSMNRTVLIGKTKKEELNVLKRDNSKYLIDLRNDK